MGKKDSQSTSTEAVLADLLGRTVNMSSEQKKDIEKVHQNYNDMSPEFRVQHKDDINIILRLIRKLIQ